MELIKTNNLNYNFVSNKEQNESYFNNFIEKYNDIEYQFDEKEKDKNNNQPDNEDKTKNLKNIEKYEENEESEESIGRT